MYIIDPKKRPSAKKLLEHKFFKIAQDNTYIYQHLVSRVNINGNSNTDDNVDRPHVCREKTVIDKAKVEKSKPVSVGSWVFDKQDFQQFKATNADEIAQERQQLGSINNNNDQSSEDELHNSNDMNNQSNSAAAPRSLPQHTAEESAEFERQNAELTMQQRIELQKQLDAVEHQVGRFKIQES